MYNKGVLRAQNWSQNPDFRGLRHQLHTVTLWCVCVDATYSPAPVISAVRGYVQHFLGCRECARNFGHGASRMLSGHRSARYTQRDGAVIWLWRSHNNANRHLRGDITEDPAHPKVQFPVPAACPLCHHGSSWNETAVLQYLVEYYGAANIIDDDIDNGAGMRFFTSSAFHNHHKSAASHNLHCAWSLHAVVVMLEILLLFCMYLKIRI